MSDHYENNSRNNSLSNQNEPTTGRKETGMEMKSDSQPPSSGRRPASRSRYPRKPREQPKPGVTNDSKTKPSQRKPAPSRRPTTRRSPTRPPARKPAPAPVRSQQKPKVTAPLIGLTACFQHNLKRTDIYVEHHYIWDPYITAIHKAGGVPIIIPVGLEGRYPNRVAENLHGLVLTGGGDIDPNFYDNQISEKIMQVDPRKDRTEFDLFNLAFNKNLPILGICRGAQFINVALDGSLYQDINTQVKMASTHMPDFPPDEPCHSVTIEPGTKLHKALGSSQVFVNSIHHQAVKLHGKGLLVNARANDGIIEGVEHPTKRWVVGVQWHPELMWENDKIQARLFKTFVDACKA